MKLIFVTGNKGKFDEAREIISDLEQSDIDLVEIQSLDSKVIIQEKLNETKKNIKGNLIVEDGGLYIESLNGLPGPLVKWFMKSVDNDGLFKMSQIFNNPKAHAKVIVGMSLENGGVEYFEGVVSGTIVSPRGENGFGWDKIFLPDGYNKTFAEMSIEEKNKISMRKIAFTKLKEYLITNNGL